MPRGERSRNKLFADWLLFFRLRPIRCAAAGGGTCSTRVRRASVLGAMEQEQQQQQGEVSGGGVGTGLRESSCSDSRGLRCKASQHGLEGLGRLVPPRLAGGTRPGLWRPFNGCLEAVWRPMWIQRGIGVGERRDAAGVPAR